MGICSAVILTLKVLRSSMYCGSTRFVQWKTIIICLQSIYCKHWNNYIITVQHSPLLVQCTYASAWQACRFCGKKIFWMGAQPLVHRQLNLIIIPELCSTQHILQWTEDMKIWRRQVGCGMHSNRSSSIVDTVALAVCGLTLSWRRHTPVVNNPRRFWRIAGFRFSLRRFE